MQDRPKNSGPIPAFFPASPSRTCASAAWRMGSAAAILVVGLGAFALLPPCAPSGRGQARSMLAANDTHQRRAAHAGKLLRPSASPTWSSG